MSDNIITSSNVVSFTQRNVPLRVCIVENKSHIRAFLAEIFEGLGFAPYGCTAAELDGLLPDLAPDLVLFGLLSGRDELKGRLIRLNAVNYGGNVMLFGGRGSLDLIESQEFGEGIGLRMLPFLGTPFRDSELAANLSSFRLVTRPERVAVDPEEALDQGWLELRYQPKIDIKTYSVFGAEAFLFVKHPARGISLADFSPYADGEKAMQALMQFTVQRAREDWSILTAGRTDPLLSFNVPLPTLEDRSFVDWLGRQFERSAHSGAIAVAISGAEADGNLGRLTRVAQTLDGCGIGTLIDCAAEDFAGLEDQQDGVFAELKADPSLANGCADNEAKQADCARLVQAARGCGARAAADGVRSRADFRMLCELGFDVIQGMLFAPPLEARKFMRLLTTHGRATA
jgi:EAL domain-containing protein (putative c-di-GMP-specific phosphodiesterase class I)